jgi:FkbM family methyltransferase
MSLPAIKRPVLELQGGHSAQMVANIIPIAGLVTATIKHRLLWRFCNVINKTFPLENAVCTVALWQDSKFQFDLGDPYWSQLLVGSYEYEADFENMIRKLDALDFDCIDCGANFGYWSIFLTSSELRNRQVVAVEASPATYEHLLHNCELNNNRFHTVLNAISDTSGQSVFIEAPNGHAGAYVTEVSEGNPGPGSLVDTTTLDDLVIQRLNLNPGRVLIKLDVEGQEINAFKGAAQLLKDFDVLFYYEDHGKDQTSKVTRYILEELKLKVMFGTRDGRVIQIDSPEQASRLKRRRTYGYNFWACKPDSSFLPFLTGK